MALLFAASTLFPAPQPADPYPLAVGNYWVYQGHVTFPAKSNANGDLFPPQTKKVTFRSEITQVVHRSSGVNVRGLKSPSITAAAFSNSPFGTGAWNRQARNAILVSLNSTMFYMINYGLAPEAARILRRVENPHDTLANLLRDTPFLVMPLAPGRHWGVPFDQWSVTRRGRTSLRGVLGFEGADDNLEGFLIETGTNTGNTSVHFVPGVGITRVFSSSLFRRGNSNHWEFEGKLVEVHLGETKPDVR